jgi:hypothetical protein
LKKLLGAWLIVQDPLREAILQLFSCSECSEICKISRKVNIGARSGKPAGAGSGLACTRVSPFCAATLQVRVTAEVSLAFVLVSVILSTLRKITVRSDDLGRPSRGDAGSGSVFVLTVDTAGRSDGRRTRSPGRSDGQRTRSPIVCACFAPTGTGAHVVPSACACRRPGEGEIARCRIACAGRRAPATMPGRTPATATNSPQAAEGKVRRCSFPPSIPTDTRCAVTVRGGVHKTVSATDANDPQRAKLEGADSCKIWWGRLDDGPGATGKLREAERNHAAVPASRRRRARSPQPQISASSRRVSRVFGATVRKASVHSSVISDQSGERSSRTPSQPR